MRRSRLPLVLAVVSLLLLLASFGMFIWSVQPPYPHGGLLLPAAVVLTIATALAAVLALLRQRRSGRKSWFVTTVLVLGCLWVALLPVSLWFARELRGFMCNEAMKGLAMTLMMYNNDYEALPPADRWCDAVASYSGRTEPWWFACPERPNLRYGFAFNASLSGVGIESIEDPVSVVMLFESDAGWNAYGGPELLPERPRHGEGDRYADAVGSVQWFPRGSVVGNALGVERKLTWEVRRKAGRMGRVEGGREVRSRGGGLRRSRVVGRRGGPTVMADGGAHSGAPLQNGGPSAGGPKSSFDGGERGERWCDGHEHAHALRERRMAGGHAPSAQYPPYMRG